ncbi:MAG: S8 family serine peptidase [Opitutales bacterium]
MKKPLYTSILILFLLLIGGGYFISVSDNETEEPAGALTSETGAAGSPAVPEYPEAEGENARTPGDPFPAAPMPHLSEEDPPSSSRIQTGKATREHSRLVRLPGENSPVRVEETVTIDSSGERIVLSQEAMLADRVLIRTATGEIPGELLELAQANGFLLLSPQSRASPIVEVHLPEATLDAVPAALEKIKNLSLPEVLSEPDYLFFPQELPDDPLLTSQWGLTRIDAPGAWRITTGSEDVVVAVIDSGMDLNHADLAGNLWRNPHEDEDGSDRSGNGFIDDISGWNFVDDNNRPEDTHGHGTHVAGIIGAVGNNGVGVAGVNWNTKLIPLSVGRESFTTSRIIAALDYATELKKIHGVNIVATNNSYGSEARSELLREAISRSRDAGILFVAAAGNEGFEFRENRKVYPAAYSLDNIVTVAATTRSDTLASFSNSGAEYVHLGAPGERIHSTLTNNGYGAKDGTSMAAPYVAGALALMKAANPELDWRELRSTLFESVDPLPDLKDKTTTGGRLNLHKAVRTSVMGPIEVRVQYPRRSSVKLADAGSELYLEASLDENGSLVELPENEQVIWKTITGPGEVVFRPFEQGVAATFQEDGVYILQAFYRGEIAPYRLAGKSGTSHSISALPEETAASDAPGSKSFHPIDIGGEKIAVHVGNGDLATEGLSGFWKLDDEDKGRTADSSGQQRDGTLNGALWNEGRIGGAFRFDGLGSNISFPAPSHDKITMTAWVKSDTSGNSIFPRILDTPEFILFFGRSDPDSFWGDEANADTVKFYAKKTGSDGVWYSPPGSVGDGTWRHIAVSYDSSEAHAFPSIYINGKPSVVGAQILPEGAPKKESGQGYIGENGRGERAWDGLIDEVRIYDRILDPTEVRLLAAEPGLSFAPAAMVEKENEPGRAGVPFPIKGRLIPDERSSSEVTFQWQTLSGPAQAAFANKANLRTTALFPEAGSYEIALVTDNNDTRTLTVAAVEITDEQPLDPPVLSLNVQETVGLQTPLYPVEVILRSDRAMPSDMHLFMDIDGNAVAGRDYDLSSEEIILPAGSNQISFYVIPRMGEGNDKDEENRFVTLRIPEGETHRRGEPNQGTVVLVEHNYTNWFHRFFQLPVALEAAATGDRSSGGIAKLMQYALGLHPKASFSRGTETAPSAGFMEMDGKTYLTLTFIRPQKLHDVTYTVEAADDPAPGANWKSLADPEFVKEIRNRGDGTEAVTVRDTVPVGEQQSRFLRLSVELTP